MKVKDMYFQITVIVFIIFVLYSELFNLIFDCHLDKIVLVFKFFVLISTQSFIYFARGPHLTIYKTTYSDCSNWIFRGKDNKINY